MKLLITILFILTASVITTAQTVCPEGLVCISQSAANQAAANVRELEATKEKVTVLESALKSKDDTIREIQETAKKNENDLKEAINRTTAELARTNGQLTGAEAMNVRLTAIIDFMLKNGRTKKYGVINF
jgi:peptidoglycan hydrolase CwlO-like protein